MKAKNCYYTPCVNPLCIDIDEDPFIVSQGTPYYEYLHRAIRQAPVFRTWVNSLPLFSSVQKQCIGSKASSIIVELKSSVSFFTSIGKRTEIINWITFYQSLYNKINNALNIQL